MRRSFLRFFVCLIIALGFAEDGRAKTMRSQTVGKVTRSANRIFRGTCVEARIGIVEVAGARIAATTYTFEIAEHLKGPRTGTVTFRQVGTPEGGVGDLGRLVGLPVFSPGIEYVLFLLPESRVGLTSPGADAFGIDADGRLVHIGAAAHVAKPRLKLEPMRYESLRAKVLEELGR